MRVAQMIILGGYLLTMAFWDVYKKEIHLGVTAAAGLLLAGMQIYFVLGGEMSWYHAFSGAFAGVLLMGVSVVSRGSIGMGDGIVFLLCGVVLGVYEALVLLFLALCLSATAGVGLLIVKKVGGNASLPFVPFVCIGYGVMWLWKIIG